MMKAWTVRQPYASLIVMGAMPHWFDKDIVPGALIEERVVVFADPALMSPADIVILYENIHFEGSAGTGIKSDIAGRLISTIREDMEREYKISRVPLGAAVGTVVLGRAVKMTDVFPDDGEISAKAWAWPLSDPDQFARPVRRTGRLVGFWNWPQPGDES